MVDIKKIPAYELVHSEKLKALDSQGMILRHTKTGARICLISNDDDNKVFQIGFRTPPADDTGVAHIIEHTVLCGSDKFPVKDPFMELVKGSLNTFLNAMTYPDKTVYPLASCNDKDFQNLCDVYLNAVFYPNIYKYEEIFLQEGWRYQLESKEAPLTINGVVYNEMKGAYSSPDEVLSHEIMASLYPDTCYCKESGGHPEHITELTRKDYLEFHRTYYHPSNSYIYLYGDMDMEEKLNWMDREYLSKFEKKEVHSEIPKQEVLKEPSHCHSYYPISSSEPLEDNTYLSYNTVVGDVLDKKLYIALDVLQYALLSAPGAPLKQALLDAKIGKDVYGTYSTSMLQPSFSIITKNTQAAKEKDFLEIIHKVLKEQIKNGINKNALEAGINSSEFRYREADFGTFPKGLLYGLECMDSWLYDDGKPFLHLEALDTYAFLREQIHTGYFEELTETYLLNNPHSSVVVLEPKRGLNQEKEQRLQKELQAKKDHMTEQELEDLIQATAHLKAYQEEPSSAEDLEKIPMLSLEDIKKEAYPFQNEELLFDTTKVLHHKMFTNGIHYLTLVFDVEGIGEEMIPYLGILKAVWGYVATKNYSFSELSNEVDRKTGGIGPTLTLYPDFDKVDEFHVKFEIHSKTFYHKMKDAMDLIIEMIESPDYEDGKRLYEIISELKSRLQMQLSSSGNSVSILRASSHFSKSAYYKDLSAGIGFYRVIDEIEKNFKEKKDELTSILKKLTNHIFRKENLLVSTTCEEEERKELPVYIAELKNHLYTGPIEITALNLVPCQQNEGFMDASQVQYVSRVGNFRTAGYEYTGAMRVLRVILSSDYLWNNIRVKGGAYDCMSGFGRNGNVFLASYRDPNLERTNKVYDETPDYIRTFEASERDITKYIIGTISSMDTPMNPAAKGERSLTSYETNLTLELVQKERDQVLAVTAQGIRELAEPVEAALKQNYLCVIGNEEKIREQEALFDKIESLS
ncbi:MAG: insulinase family protein [Lachnospiraceae bacterium]